ncbi:hypothetical protein BH10CHL1_BH10CHL1_20040 [soil metagenome]
MNKNINKAMQGKWKQVRKDWKRTRKELQKRWEKLTDDDVHQIDDQLDKMVDLLQKRYGHSWEDASAELEHYLGDYRTRTQEAISETLDRLNRKPRTAPWLWALVLLGLVATGYFLPSLSGQRRQLSDLWRSLSDTSTKPGTHQGDANQPQG